tara:strand:+ start:1080 stop:2021 length:942 start_codon:yes stop_codon:yes gene_type:complete
LKKEKLEIIKNLKRLIDQNSFIKDIWIYGSFKDQVSDLDLLILYEKGVKKINFPKIIKRYVLDGTIIYIPYSIRYDIFLFEDLKIFSVKLNKKIKKNLNFSENKFRFLTSFLERYYERRQKFYRLKKDDIKDSDIRIIKSLIFSYEMFYKYLSLIKINYKKQNLFINYNKIRKLYLKNRLSKTKINNYLINMKTFDLKFYNLSNKILEQNYSNLNIKKFSILFLNKYKFSLDSKNKLHRVPKLFGAIYQYYASQNFSLSKLIKKDLNVKNKLILKDKKLKDFLYKKIFFINKAYVDVKKAGFKSGIYRFSWYL